MATGYKILPRPDTSDVSVTLIGDVSGAGTSPITTTVNLVGGAAAADVATATNYLVPGPLPTAVGGTNNTTFDTSVVVITNEFGDQLQSSSITVDQLNGFVSRKIVMGPDPTGPGDVICMVNTLSVASCNLPDPAANSNRLITFVDQTGNWNVTPLTLVRNADESIGGAQQNYDATSQWGSFTIFSDGTDWFFY